MAALIRRQGEQQCTTRTETFFTSDPEKDIVRQGNIYTRASDEERDIVRQG